MATFNKDFKVKNGLVVALGGSFGNAVTVGTPTENAHATTKEYVDAISANLPSIVVSDTAPASPSQGDLWFDTITTRLYVFDGEIWSAQASLSDAANLQDHIHDTAIDGSGRIVSIFIDGGAYNEAGSLADAGMYNQSSWTETWDGGIAIDNFN